MRSRALSSVMILGGALIALLACQQQPKASPGAQLAWAYPKGPKEDLPPYPAGELHVPGSTVTYTGEALNKGGGPPDWFPQNHPPAPQIVAKGRDGVTACAECHRIGGDGYNGTTDLAGLKAEYIVQQIQEFRSGRRHSWEAGRPAVEEMIGIARKVSDADAQAAAAYFSALPRIPHTRVVEGDTAPAARGSYYGWMQPVPGQPARPLNGQVVELDADWNRALLADPNSPLVIYAPVGSTAAGEALVRSGGPNGQACSACHGPSLKGSAIAPPLAGRSAAYLARQLLDIKTGARSGPAVAQMQGPAQGLDDTQIRDIAVYAASLTP
ncbi:c-type cytochrome [uncultured Caulobacter sp.]|uniref:c-type cytochrome n=1 Tax=uncultured Caulobacter sp. TaxID=158749 RepID=UPI00261DEF40|nr:c-type cytochrome [uncultured Caulobacter sp.]